MANSNALLMGWNRAVAGREQEAVELFLSVSNFYEAQKKAGRITSYEHYFLSPHGGDLNGFTIVQGEPAKLDELRRSDEWTTIEMKAVLVLEGFGVIYAAHGADLIGSLMQKYMSVAPKR